MRTPSSWPGVGLRGASAVAALLTLGFGMAAAIAPADASKVGVAAAVNPDAFSSLSGAPTNQLNIGKSIFFNERIKTTDSGLVQVLLVDGSTFTVGPGSELVIDKFVYNPKKQTGEITTTFSKGVVRYVGGKISKNEDAVKMKTPAGALAIRGGMFQAKINSGGKGIFSFLYGVGLTFVGKNGQVYKVFQPGYTLDLTSGTPTIRPTTAADTNSIMKAFAKGGSGTGTADTGGDGGTKPNNTNGNTVQASTTISEIINTFTQAQLQATLEEELKNLDKGNPPPDTSGTPPVIGGGGDDGCKVDCGPIVEPKDPVPVNVRVVSGTDLDVTERIGELGGRLSGSLSATDKPTINFPWFQPDQTGAPCKAGICDITSATIKFGEATTNLAGVGVFKPGFFAYHLRAPNNQERDPIVAFGGTRYNFSEPNGDTNKLYSFDIGTLSLHSLTPLSAANRLNPGLVQTAGGDRAFASHLEVLDNGVGSARGGVWLQSGFSLSDDQHDALISVSLGDWTEQTGLKGHTRVGLLQLGPEGSEGSSFSANVKSLAGPDNKSTNPTLSHFMGTGKPNVVVESAGNTHIGVGTDISNRAAPIGSYTGFAAGLAQGNNGTTIIGNLYPNDVTVSIDATANTVLATFGVGDGSAQNPSYKLEFGGPGRSAAIDSDRFAAVEAPSGSSVTEEYLGFKPSFPFIQVKHHTDDNPVVQGFIVSADAIKANEILYGFHPQTKQPNHRAFCNQCDFIKWGAWGAQVTYQDRNNHSVTKNVPLGWWIAGNVVPSVPNTGVATYTGDAVGTVRNGASQYLAKGNMTMGWDFARRSGLLYIENFDKKNFAAVMGANRNTPERFNGIMAGSNGATGAANGAFVGPNGGNFPKGVIGNFGVGKPGYQATGIYGGVLKP